TREQKVIIWQTDSVAGNFSVECTPVGTPGKAIKAKPVVTKLSLLNKTTLLYRATLTGLKTDQLYHYKVYLNGNMIAETQFETRTKKPSTRFAVFGDCGAGTQQQAEIAFQVYQQKPQFVLVTGDMVYNNGRELEYRHRFFPYYLAPQPSPEKGAPLMNAIPFYMLLGNHDTYSANLDKHPDGLAYFYYTDLPRNAPVTTLTVTPTGNPQRISAFKKNTVPRFPVTANYSFDYGNVHITCLDANDYVNPLDPLLIEWLRNDIGNSKADWKIVAYHHPGFSSAKAHYNQQWMRLLSPVLEQLGVNLVLTGHVHNYQRSVPLKFAPKKDETGTRYIVSDEGRVDGTFSLDARYDGETNTKPDGIIYIVTGAGGASLYDKDLGAKTELWKHDPPENWVPYTAKMITDVHSFTWIETDGKILTIKQLDVHGKVLDEITITQ
ncbi:MAG: metallophosphoesterase family protein, partial [Cyclobacteriaceae bacterium]